MAAAQEWLTIPEIVRAAYSKLPRDIWDYGTGGSETETTLRRNRSAFDYLAFNPRVLRGVSGRDLTASFMGQRLSLPVMFAPVGSIGHYHPDGALACARVAERVGTATFVSTMAVPSLVDVREGADGPQVFQVYVRGDRAWMGALVDRAVNAGYDGICITADSAVYGRRERDLHNRYLARESHVRPNFVGLPASAGNQPADEYQAALTWDDLDWVRDRIKIPLILKGVQSAADASLAVEHGVDVIYVSNHGGRQLDHAPSTIEVLGEIVGAVNGRARVVMDSGIMRGSDVVKALALGADAVLIGKLMTWGLAAGGEAGLERTLEILKMEISTTMANVGARTIADLGPECLRPTRPPEAAPWPVGAAVLDPTI